MNKKCSKLIFVKTIRWREICFGGESLHVALARTASERHWSMHRHDFYECFHIEEGGGWHVLPKERPPLKPGHFVFMRPEHIHGFQSTASAPLHLNNIALAAPVMEAFLARHAELFAAWRSAEEPVTLVLTPWQRRAFTDLVALLGASGRGAVDAEFFLAGLARLLREPVATPHEALPDWLWDALPVMSEPENLRLGVPRLRQLCGRTPEHVSRTFMRCFGQTPTDWLAGARLRHARRLLETTTLSVLDVALECGYDSMSHFHRLFKDDTGTTPLAYRRRAASVQTG